MKVVEEHGWAGSVTALSYGLTIRIRVSDGSILPVIKDLLPPYWKEADPTDADLVYSLAGGGSDPTCLYTAYSDTSLIAEHSDIEVVLRALESSLQLEVADRAKDRVFVHAGVVGWRGRAIILPGRSMAGKTTLVGSLIAAGCSYYSDEFAVLDAEGLVHPYARPLSVREKAGVLPRRVSPEVFGARPGQEPIPAGLVLLSRYVPGAAFRPRPVSRGRAVLGLMDNTVPIRRDPERSLSALVAMSKPTLCWKGTRGDCRETTQFIMNATRSW